MPQEVSFNFLLLYCEGACRSGMIFSSVRDQKQFFMRSCILLTGLIAVIFLAAFAAGPGLKISSPAFKHNGNIPLKYSCEGDNVSPPLHIGNIPGGTESLAIIMHDPDADKPGGFTHWVAWNIDPVTEIPAQYTAGMQGRNSGDKTGYTGMCPPTGSHHYHFRVYALDRKLDLPAGVADKAGLEKAMQGHILAEGLLTGTYYKQHPDGK
jgi:Raf kinase inhibitor-like YbhB/YbcL family protein